MLPQALSIRRSRPFPAATLVAVLFAIGQVVPKTGWPETSGHVDGFTLFQGHMGFLDVFPSNRLTESTIPLSLPARKHFAGLFTFRAQILDPSVGHTFAQWQVRVLFDHLLVPLHHVLKGRTGPE